jgi:putative phosphoesterase
MKKIAIISDTHSFLETKITNIFKKCDEVWHAGDFGYNSNIEKMIETNKVRGVYGNIDGQKIRNIYPKIQRFECEKMKILMTHIGGYPGKYLKHIEKEIQRYKPNIFISGHSHIVKIIYDNKYNLLHINPGAAGKEGFHIMRTIVLLYIDGKKISNLKLIELGERAKII